MKTVFKIFAVLLISIVSLYFFFKRDQIDSHLEGLTRDVDILQIEKGAKVVKGETFIDAIYGLGFVTAKDRLWQLHFTRLLA